MMLLLHWLISAISLMIVAHLIPGFHVAGLGTALIAAIVIGFVNATIGFVLKIVTFPLTVLSFGLFLFVINALMLRFASVLVPGFVVTSFGPAFLGAIVLAMVSALLRSLIFD